MERGRAAERDVEVERGSRASASAAGFRRDDRPADAASRARRRGRSAGPVAPAGSMPAGGRPPTTRRTSSGAWAARAAAAACAENFTQTWRCPPRARDGRAAAASRAPARRRAAARRSRRISRRRAGASGRGELPAPARGSCSRRAPTPVLVQEAGRDGRRHPIPERRRVVARPLADPQAYLAGRP